MNHSGLSLEMAAADFLPRPILSASSSFCFCLRAESHRERASASTICHFVLIDSVDVARAPADIVWTDDRWPRELVVLDDREEAGELTWSWSRSRFLTSSKNRCSTSSSDGRGKLNSSVSRVVDWEAIEGV